MSSEPVLVTEPAPPFDLRRSIDLRLDAEGRWFHDGEPFTHPGLIGLFNRGIDVLADTGEPILRIGAQWCYIRCDDTPFVVRSVQALGASLRVVLNTEVAAELPPEALRAGANGVLYAELGPGRRARFSRSAQAAMAEHLDDAGGLAVVIEGKRWPIQSLAAQT